MKEQLEKAYQKLASSFVTANKGKKIDYFFSRGTKEAAVAKNAEEGLRVESDAFSNFLESFVIGLNREDDHLSTKYSKAML